MLVDDETGTVVRTGQTSDLVKRRSDHARAPNTTDYRFETVFRTDDYAERRGLEQLLHDAFPESSLNRQRGLDLRNQNLSTYLEAAYEYLRRSP